MRLRSTVQRPTRHLVLLLAIATLACPITARTVLSQSGVKASMVVSVNWLQDHLADSDLVVLHVDHNRDAYNSGHIPGARFVNYEQVITTRSGLQTEIPSADHLQELVESLGISTSTRVVLYGDLLASTRLYFTLDYLGHGDRTALLSGGLDGWRASGAVVTQDLPDVVRGTYHPSLRPDVVIGIDEIVSGGGAPGRLLVDARSWEEYTGSRVQEGLPRTGHLPGARHLEWSSAVTDGRLAGPVELQSLLQEAGAISGSEVVTYCRVGTRASFLYFVAKYLGYPVRLYDGSMDQWSARTDLPLVSGDRAGSWKTPR